MGKHAVPIQDFLIDIAERVCKLTLAPSSSPIRACAAARQDNAVPVGTLPCRARSFCDDTLSASKE